MLVSCLSGLISCFWGLPTLLLYEGFLRDLQALFHSLASLDNLPGEPTDYLSEQLEVCFPKVQEPNFTTHQTHIPQDSKFHQRMVTATRLLSFFQTQKINYPQVKKQN